MKKIFKALFVVGTSIFLSLFTGCSVSEYMKNAVLGHIPFAKNFVQRDFATYTSITGVRDSMQLVTAKQQLDFINIMDGKDGRYLEVSTFEVKAGIDCAKIQRTESSNGEVKFDYPPVEIFSSSKIHSVLARSNSEKNEPQFYENCIKPVNMAYEQKAKDYAVELGILDNAKKGAENTLKNLTSAKINLNKESYSEKYEILHLPFILNISNTYFSERKMKNVPQKNDKFYRDAFIVESAGNGTWQIRIGDSGRTFDGTFEDFYQNVFETNTAESNFQKDKVEIFRYFDPMYPKECEVLGYASDHYRTMFVLNDGHIYYVDAVVDNEQTLINDISPTMVYLASSLRKINDEKIENYTDYEQYISNFFDVQESIRTNDSRIALKNNVERLIKSNSIRESNEKLSQDEKYILALSDVKSLGRTESESNVEQTGEQDFDNTTALIKKLLLSVDDFTSEESRETAIRIATDLDTRIYHEKNKKSANSQYLETWFLQNSLKFGLSKETIKRYEDDIRSGTTYIASRPMIARLSDSERNEYFYSLFRNKLAMSHYLKDTAEAIDDSMKKSIRGSNMFIYYNIPKFNELADGDVYEQMKKLNNGKEIDNAFIFVFNQIDWDFGIGKDDDIHAIVLDDATFRFFPNIGSQNIVERATENISPAHVLVGGIVGGMLDLLLSKDKTPRYFFYGDWKNLRVTPENLSIAGHNFATKKFTKKSKTDYRNTNDYAEKSVIATVIDDLQHAYSNEDSDYYFNILRDNLENQVSRHVYSHIFRPSPRMVIDTREDARHRYNF